MWFNYTAANIVNKALCIQVVFPHQSSADVRGEAAGVSGRAAETRGGNATDVRPESQRERGRAERRRERSTTFMIDDCCASSYN